MTRKTSWKVCATTARPRIATASQTRSPRIRPAANEVAPSGPLPTTCATSAAMPGPGDAAATSKVPAKRTSAARSISDILERTKPQCSQPGTPATVTARNHHPARRAASARRDLEHGGLTMMGVTDRNRERVRRVLGLRIGLRQQHADHHADLALLAVAGAHDGLLHQVGRVFGNRQAGERRHQHGYAARLPELERRRCVLVDEGRLHRRLVRRVRFDHAAQAVVDSKEPPGELRPVVGRERAASKEAQAIAVDRYHPPAGAAQPGVDTEYANRGAHDPALITPPARRA